MSLSILPECYADTLMMEILGFARANHCPSIGEVANRMKKNYNNRLAIGIIDKDKPGTVPAYFNDFELLDDFGGLELKHLAGTKHFIVVVNPALEQWILNTAEDLDVDLKRYKFDNLKKIKVATKSQNVNKNENFKALLNTLKQKKGSPLKKITEELNEIIETKGKKYTDKKE